MSTCSLACGEQAGLWLYGAHPFQVIPNAFDTEKFVFNLNDRMAVRKQLGSDCGTVIGHVGTFCEPKNQGYLIRAFEKIAFQDDTAVLLLVGTGQDMEAARDQKGFDYLLQIWRKIEDDPELDGWILQIVGSGSKEMDLHKQEEELKLERVEWRGLL